MALKKHETIGTKIRHDKSRVAILNIGNELLSGTTINKNMGLIGQCLSEFGIEAEIQISVPDNGKNISSALRVLTASPGLIISTGGLGPTSDDITKNVFANFFKLKIKRDKSIECELRKSWEKRRRGKIPSSIFRQADILIGTQVVLNDVGTAPGFIIRSPEKKIILLVLPGPPLEAIPMLKKVIGELIHESELGKGYCRRILSSGLPESSIESITENILNGFNGVVPAYCASSEGVKIYLKSKNAPSLEKCAKKIERKLGTNLIGHASENIFEEIIAILRERNEKLSLAESCTGGLIAKKITDISGSSEVFEGGIVAYSDSIKQKLLNLPKSTLEKYGAVSEKTALGMLKGLEKIFKTAGAISITGIAGPKGGSATKPLGLVFIGTLYKGKCEIRKYLLSGGREQIRERATALAIKQLKNLIYTP